MASKIFSVVRQIKKVPNIYISTRSVQKMFRSVSATNKYSQIPMRIPSFKISETTRNVLIKKQGIYKRLSKCKRMNYKVSFHQPVFRNVGSSSAIFQCDQSSYVIKQYFRFSNEWPLTNNDCIKESDILNQLQAHPNIVSLVKSHFQPSIIQNSEFCTICPDIEIRGITSSIILENMDGNLEDLIKYQKLTDINDKCDVISQIFEAQAFLNDQGIVHRDIKLSNILFRSNDLRSIYCYAPKFRIKLADFDCALDLKTTSDESHRGAPLAAAPEIANPTQLASVTQFYINTKELIKFTLEILKEIVGIEFKSFRKFKVLESKSKFIDVKLDKYAKSDVWAIGGVIYEIFGLENPFSKISQNNYSVNDLPEIPGAPSVIKRLIKSVLDPDTSKRYCSNIAADIINMLKLKRLALVYPNEDEINVFVSSILCDMQFTAERMLSDPRKLKFVDSFIESESNCIKEE